MQHTVESSLCGFYGGLNIGTCPLKCLQSVLFYSLSTGLGSLVLIVIALPIVFVSIAFALLCWKLSQRWVHTDLLINVYCERVEFNLKMKVADMQSH
jgi:hypothetical protein